MKGRKDVAAALSLIGIVLLRVLYEDKPRDARQISKVPSLLRGKRKLESSSFTESNASTLPEASSTPNLFTSAICPNDGCKYPVIVLSSCVILLVHWGRTYVCMLVCGADSVFLASVSKSYKMKSRFE